MHSSIEQWPCLRIRQRSILSSQCIPVPVFSSTTGFLLKGFELYCRYFFFDLVKLKSVLKLYHITTLQLSLSLFLLFFLLIPIPRSPLILPHGIITEYSRAFCPRTHSWLKRCSAKSRLLSSSVLSTTSQPLPIPSVWQPCSWRSRPLSTSTSTHLTVQCMQSSTPKSTR